MVKDAAVSRILRKRNGKKFARVQLLTIEGLLNGSQRAEHPDYEPDLNFKKAKAETGRGAADADLSECGDRQREPFSPWEDLKSQRRFP